MNAPHPFEAFVRRYQDMVFATAVRLLGNAADAEDAAQTVFLKAFAILLRERPKALVTTGSAPMLAFVLLARLMGVRTLWIDSIANSERLSSSGRLAKKLAHRVVSQWPDVAEREGVACWGAVI